MAMRMDDCFALELRRTIVSLVDQKLAKQICLALELLRFNIVAKQVGHLVAEDGDAAWFDSDDWRARFDVAAQGCQRLFQCGFGLSSMPKS